MRVIQKYNNMPNENVIKEKSKKFALDIIDVYLYLCNEKKEYILSRQLLRCGTSIGANVKEAIRGQSKPDFYAKMNIALKEASETEYWLELLIAKRFITQEQFQGVYARCQELIRILMAITKTQHLS